MADKNVLIQRNNAGTIDNVYPQTQWGNVLNKPSTFTPTAHSHGNITDTGTITADTAVASGQKFVLVNGSDQIVRSALALGTSTTTFLRNDGTWATPAGVDNFVNTTGDTMTGNLTVSSANVLVTGTGNVGVGTASPAVKLHVVGGTRITGQLNVMGDAETKRLWVDYEDGNDLGTIQVIHDGTAYKNLALQPDGSNVGIGTRSPATKLDVNGAINTNNNISWANGNADINGQDTNLKFRTWTGSALTEKMRITGAGNVGIGTTAPATTFSVITSANADGIQIRRNSDTTNDYALLGFRILTSENQANLAEIRGVRTNRLASAETDLTFLTRSAGTIGERMRIRDDGNVGIGTTSPGEKLEVSGNAKATTFISTQATGTAPLTVASTTAVTNLNADLLDGNHAAAFATSTHTHGNISNAGGWQNTPQTIASGDTFVITKSGLLNNASLAFGTGTTTYLRNDGTWGTPTGSGVGGSGTANQITYWTDSTNIGALSTATYPSLTELSYVKGVTSAIQTQIGTKLDAVQIVDTYKATQTTANSTTDVSYHTITLLPGHYYQLFVQGIWSKVATTNSVGAVISMICNDLTGSPTFHGSFEWLQNTSATAYTVENNVVNLVSSGTTLGFTTTATTGVVGGTYWGMKGLVYTGTTNNKTLTFQIACSAAPSTGTVALDRIAITAVRVS